MADIAAPNSLAATGDQRNSLHKLMQRKSTIAFLMALPLILLILILVAYPAGYAVWLSMLNKSMTKFVGFGTFAVALRPARRGFNPHTKQPMKIRAALSNSLGFGGSNSSLVFRNPEEVE